MDPGDWRRSGRRRSMLGCGLVLMLATWCGIAAESVEPASSTNPGPTSTWLWQRWSREHGLPDNRVLGVIQTREGHLWAATPTGLARFDGRHWEVFHRANVPGFLTEPFNQLVADVRGGFWLTLHDGLVRWNGRAFVSRVLVEPGEWTGPSCAASGGGVWIATQQGLRRARDDATQLFGAPSTVPPVRPWFPWPLREIEGKLWLSHPYGTMRLDPLTGIFDGETRPPGDESPTTVALERDDRGAVWGLIQPRKAPHCWLARYESGAWTTNRDVAAYNGGHPVFLLRDRRGYFWVPGGKGRIAYVREGRRFEVPLPAVATEDFALAMAEDFDGGLWVTTEASGLLRLRPSRVRALSVAEGLPDKAVWAILEARDGSVWIGTDGGVSRWREERFTHWTQHDGLSRNTVRALAEDADGRIWIGTGGGLNCLENGRLRRGHLPEEWSKRKVRAMIAGRDRTLWLGAARGLYRAQLPANLGSRGSDDTPARKEVTLASAGAAISDERATDDALSSPFTFTAIPGPTNDHQPADVLALLEDRAGTLWVGTGAAGLCRVQDGQLEPVTTADGFLPHSVWALHEDETGALWLGTEQGLARLKDNRGFTFSPKHGLPDDFVNHIAQDDRGSLWFGGEQGIYRLSKHDLDDVADGRRSTALCVAYDEDEDLPTRETNGRKNQPGALRTSDGRLWFATARGAAIFNPRELPDQTHPPPVVLTRVLAAGQTVFDHAPGPPGPADTNFATTDPRALTAALPPGAGRVLEIHYTANTFVAAEKLRFKHRLEGFEREWTDAGARRVAQYANLAPGRYRFQVLAAGKYGVWNETGASFAFTVAPFVWQTTWFRALGILAPLLGVYGYYRRRLLQHRRRADTERQAAVSTERAEIARDLHDHLGVRLTLVQRLVQSLDPGATSVGPGEAATRRLADLARELNANLDSAVWAVKPDKDTLANLADYLGDTFHELLDGTGIELDLDFPEALPVWPLSRTERYHLALIAVEALNNALKHAHPTLVRLRLETRDSAFEFHIADDGCGFDPQVPAPEAAPGRGGNGLANMRRRMEALGGRCNVSSAPGRGTTVTLTLSPAALRASPPSSAP